MQSKIGVIIQARTGSTRLSNKVLLPLPIGAGKTREVLRVVVDRIRCGVPDDTPIIVATTLNPNDDIIVDFCIRHEIEVFRGSESDVLGRTIACAEAYGLNHIIDITSDCPLVDPNMIAEMLEIYQSQQYAYTHNIMPRSWPDGMDIQIYSLFDIREASMMSSVMHEHSGYNLARNIGDGIGYIPEHYYHAPSAEYNLPDFRITLDTMDDYKRIYNIFAAMSVIHGNHTFSTIAAIDAILAGEIIC